MGSGKLKRGWTRVAFGDVAVSVNDRIDNPLDAGVERYVGLEHLDSDSLAIRRWASPSAVTATKLLFRRGDIIFGRRRVYQRKLAVANFDGICSAHALVLRAKSKVVLPEFLPFFMQSAVFMERAKAISVGSLSPTINWRTLAKEEFDLPPLDEQRRMAHLLVRIEAASRALHDAHAALTVIRKSLLMHSFGQLLTDRAVRKLPVGQIGEVLLGRQRAPQHEDGPSMHPYLRAANVFDGYIDTADVKSMNFSPGEYEQYKVRNGDILLVEGNSSRYVVGRSAIFRSEIPCPCFQNTLLRFRPGPEVLSQYAHQYFQYCVYTGSFAAIAKQTSIAHLGAQNLTNLLIPLPNRNRQTELSRHLSAVDSALPSAVEREQDLRSLTILVSIA